MSRNRSWRKNATGLFLVACVVGASTAACNDPSVAPAPQSPGIGPSKTPGILPLPAPDVPSPAEREAERVTSAIRDRCKKMQGQLAAAHATKDMAERRRLLDEHLVALIEATDLIVGRAAPAGAAVGNGMGSAGAAIAKTPPPGGGMGPGAIMAPDEPTAGSIPSRLRRLELRDEAFRLLLEQSVQRQAEVAAAQGR